MFKKIILLIISAPFVFIIGGLCYIIKGISDGVDDWVGLINKKYKKQKEE